MTKASHGQREEVISVHEVATRTYNLLAVQVVLVAFLILSPTDTSSDRTKDSAIPRTIDGLTTRIDSLRQDYGIPGLGIALVCRDSVIWMGGVGLANVETGEAVTEDTHFRVGSCTKSFVGLGFLKLVDEGRIDLNTPVREIAPEIGIENPWSETNPVRVVHLLEHTAGFDDSHINSLYNREDPEMPLRRALEAKAGLRKVRWPPGTRYAYSSPGYTLAGYILEKITGQRYEDYLEEAILEPIGMTTSTFRLTDESKRLLSVGYGGDGKPVPYFDGYDRPASSLNSSTKEMALFVQMLLNRGEARGQQVISAASIDRVGWQTTTIAARAGLRDGYAFGVGVRFQDGFKWYGHSGGGPGYIAKYSYTKDSGLGYVVLADRFSISDFGKITRLVQRYLMREVEPPVASSETAAGSELQGLSGYYEYLSSRQQLVAFLDLLLGGTTISFENDTLYQRDFMSEKEALIPVSMNTFRRTGEPAASSVFTTTAGGKKVYATIESYYERAGSWKPVVRRALVFSALGTMASAVIYMFFWVPVHVAKKLLKKENRSKYLRLRVIPLLAVLSILTGSFVVTKQSLVRVGGVTPNNVIFFLSTLLFAALSIASVACALRSFWKPVRTIARVYATILSLALLGMTVYLSYWGIVGLRIWAY